MGNAKERILVVESDPVICDLIARQALQSMGYQVLQASDANSAIPMVSQFAPDVVIVNLELPGLSGKDFMAAMTAQGMAIPVIVLAPKGREADLMQAFRLGAADYLQWPARDAEVVSVVERVLKQVRDKREGETLTHQLQTTNQKLQHRVYELAMLLKIGQAITSVNDRRILFDRIVDGAIQVTHADMGWFMLHDDQLKNYILAAQRGLPAALVKRPWDDGISSQVVTSGEPLSISGDRLKHFKIANLGQAVLVVPIKAQKRVLGVLAVLRQALKPFDLSEKNLLEAVSDYASISLVNARLLRVLNDRAQSLQHAAETASLNEKINNDLMRAALNTFSLPVTQTAGAVERILQGQAGVVTDEQARLLLASQEQLLELTEILEATKNAQQGAASAPPTLANLNELSRQAISAVQRIAQRNQVTLAGDYPPGDVIAQADSAQVLHCILGLLSNAIKFSPPGRPVILRVSSDKLLAHLTVKDSGAGISPRQLPHLFDPDFTRSTLPLHTFSGLGIRLSLIKEIVAAQRGRVWAESQPGQGSVFHVTLPLARKT